MKYTFSDEEDGGSDAISTRRSNRQSGMSTPAEHSGPTFTASGRQVRSRHGGSYGESIPSQQVETSEQPISDGLDGAADDEAEPKSRGRSLLVPQKIRSQTQRGEDDSLGSMDDESDVTSSEGEWEGGDDEDPDEPVEDEDDDEDIEMSDEQDPQQSLIVSLRYLKSHSTPPMDNTCSNGDFSNYTSVPSNKTFNPDASNSSSLAPPASNSTQPALREDSHDRPPIVQPNSPSTIINPPIPSKPEHHFLHENQVESQEGGHLEPLHPQKSFTEENTMS